MKLKRPPKPLRRFLKVVLWFAGLLFGPLLLYLMAAITLGMIPVNRHFEQAGNGVGVYLTSNGVHVDFVLPVQWRGIDWSDLLPYDQFTNVDDGHRYLYFGWGERNFYLETPTWDDLTFSTAAHALLLPTSTVMHVEYAMWPPPLSETTKRLVLSATQYQNLAREIVGSFRTRDGGEFQLIPGHGYRGTDNFYQANGTYHAFNTCNMWTNGVLKEVGVTTAFWSPFAKAILYHLE